MGVRGVAEEAGATGAELEDLADRGVVVGGTAAVAAADEHLEHLAAELAVVGIGEERLDARAGVLDHPFPFVTPSVGGRGGGRHLRLCQPLEPGGGVDDHETVVLVLEDILGKLRGERGELLIDGRHLLLCRIVKRRPTTDEVGVHEPGEALLFWSEPSSLPCVVDRLDAVEELLILEDLVGKVCQLRRHLALDFLNGVIGEIAPPNCIDRLDSLEVAGRLLERINCVGKRRHGWVSGDARDGVELGGDRDLERRAEIFDANLVERRHAAVGACPGTVDRRRFGGERHRMGEARKPCRQQEPCEDHRSRVRSGAAGRLGGTLHVPVLQRREGQGRGGKERDWAERS